MAYRLSVDTGGTFTDVVVADLNGKVVIGKALTTSERIFLGMREAIGVAAEQIGIAVAIKAHAARDDGAELLAQTFRFDHHIGQWLKAFRKVSWSLIGLNLATRPNTIASARIPRRDRVASPAGGFR